MIALSTRIRQERLIREIQQKEMAQEVGISQQHLSDIENGHRNPSQETLMKIARFFGFEDPYNFLADVTIERMGVQWVVMGEKT